MDDIIINNMKDSWKIYKGYFLGETLEDEMAFANYFHKHPLNKFGHLFISFLMPVAAFLLLRTFVPTFILWLALGVYGMLMIPISVISTIIYLLSWITIINFGLRIEDSWIAGALYLVFIWGPLGLSCHAAFERSLPAFRFLEAFIVTPTLLIFWILSFVGIYSEFYAEIERLTPKWKGSKYEKVLC
jgi:uncharacterized membrane protein YGL010W